MPNKNTLTSIDAQEKVIFREGLRGEFGTASGMASNSHRSSCCLYSCPSFSLSLQSKGNCTHDLYPILSAGDIAQSRHLPHRGLLLDDTTGWAYYKPDGHQVSKPIQPQGRAIPFLPDTNMQYLRVLLSPKDPSQLRPSFPHFLEHWPVWGLAVSPATRSVFPLPFTRTFTTFDGCPWA